MGVLARQVVPTIRRLVRALPVTTLVSRALAVLLLCCASTADTADHPSVTEYRVKAAFLYNFSRFVTWPVKIENSFKLCVVGSNPFDSSLDSLIGKTVHDNVLVVEYHDTLATVYECHLVYIGQSFAYKLKQSISALRDLPILTVSDIKSFTHYGGIIRFRLIANKVRFDINVEAAEHTGLTISSKLLSLASIVKTGQ